MGASRAFFEDKTLQVAANISLCYNEIQYQSKNLSVGGDMSVGYTLKKNHVFSFMAALSKYGDVNLTHTRSTLDATDLNLSLNYTYTFSLLEIKRKADKKAGE